MSISQFSYPIHHSHPKYFSINFTQNPLIIDIKFIETIDFILRRFRFHHFVSLYNQISQESRSCIAQRMRRNREKEIKRASTNNSSSTLDQDTVAHQTTPVSNPMVPINHRSVAQRLRRARERETL
ncbi:hypothetical protein ACHQM5_003366 [Ranunculus cassubicifolius]